MLPTDRVRTSPAACTTTSLQENEYEMHSRHAFAHGICHNHCGCAGWHRAGPPEATRHRHATAGSCADDCFADKAAVEAVVGTATGCGMTMPCGFGGPCPVPSC